MISKNNEPDLCYYRHTMHFYFGLARMVEQMNSFVRGQPNAVKRHCHAKSIP